MSRLTSNEVSGLMEAYASVYEGYGKKKGKKKIMHNCATHVEHSEYGLGNCIEEMHTLDEEGNVSHYDVEFEHGIVENVPVSELNILVLVEHPHEANEMKNAEVLDEMGQPGARTTGQATAPKPAPAKVAPAKPLPAGNFQQTRSTGRGTSQTRTLYRSSSDNKVYANYNDALAARNSRMNSLRGAQDMLKGKTPAPLGATPAQRAKPLPGTPGAAAPRPAAAAPAPRPAAPAPAARPAAAPVAAKPAVPAPAPKAAPTPALPASASVAGTFKPVPGAPAQDAKFSVAAPAAPKPQLSARAQALKAGGPQGGARERMLNQDLDLFDIIKGHLLDEGYADTEEAALKIMANMSEEWKRSIIEDAPLRDEPLWDMAGDKPKPPVKKPQPPVVKKPTPQAPMRDEPLW